MRLKSKTILSIVAFCSCVSLFSVGFANWVICKQPEYNMGGGFYADSVQTSEDYIVAGEPTGLTYSASGFCSESSQSLLSDSVSIPLTINAGNARTLFGANEVEVSVKMYYSGSVPKNKVFSSDFMTANIQGATNSTTNFDPNNEWVLVSATVSLGSGTDISLTAVFTLEFKDEPTYISHIYEVLQSGTQFAFEAAIKGGN